MKRVICIDNGFLISYLGIIRNAPELEVGATYTVQSETERGYHLVEQECVGFHFGYNKSRFIFTSEIDETQMERNYQKEKV